MQAIPAAEQAGDPWTPRVECGIKQLLVGGEEDASETVSLGRQIAETTQNALQPKNDS